MKTSIHKIKKIIFKLIKSISRNQDIEYDENIHIYDGYGLDSAQYVTLLIEIENIFEIEFADEMLVESNKFTIASLAAFLQELKEK